MKPLYGFAVLFVTAMVWQIVRDLIAYDVSEADQQGTTFLRKVQVSAVFGLFGAIVGGIAQCNF